jgi:hypothetical protein
MSWSADDDKGRWMWMDLLASAGVASLLARQGPRGSDSLTLSVAQAIEESVGGFRAPPFV